MMKDDARYRTWALCRESCHLFQLRLRGRVYVIYRQLTDKAGDRLAIRAVLADSHDFEASLFPALGSGIQCYVVNWPFLGSDRTAGYLAAATLVTEREHNGAYSCAQRHLEDVMFTEPY